MALLFPSSPSHDLFYVHQFAKSLDVYKQHTSYPLHSNAIHSWLMVCMKAKPSEGKFNSAWMSFELLTTTKIYKGLRGIIGLTFKDKTLTRCFLSRPVITKYSMTFHNHVCQSTVKPNQTEQYKATVWLCRKNDSVVWQLIQWSLWQQRGQASHF